MNPLRKGAGGRRGRPRRTTDLAPQSATVAARRVPTVPARAAGDTERSGLPRFQSFDRMLRAIEARTPPRACRRPSSAPHGRTGRCT